MSCILVTGCAGFIGSSLSDRLLELGHNVRGIDCFLDYYPRKIKENNLRSTLGNPAYELVESSILNADLPALLDGVDYVFHQAAQAGVRDSWGKSFGIYTENNILATQMLLEACRDSRVKRLVYASSSSVYGVAESLPMKESDVPRPVSPYGMSKLAGEQLCYLYWKNYSVPSVSLRYFTVYGPRQRPDMAFNKFIRALMAGEEIIVYGGGDQTRDFTFISDIVNANVLAMESTKGGAEIYNIGGGTRTTLSACIKVLERLMGKKARIRCVQTQKGDVVHTYADTSKAARDLGYAPRVSLEEGLAKEVSWILKEGKTCSK